MKKPTLYIMMGLPAAGKSTWTKRHPNARRIDIDEIVTEVEGDYRGYRLAAKPYYKSLETIRVIHGLLAGNDVILDRTCYKRSTRERFIRLAHAFGAEAVVVWITSSLTPRQHGLRRYLKDSRGLTMAHWVTVCDRMASLFEMPTQDEGYDRIEIVKGAQTLMEGISL